MVRYDTSRANTATTGNTGMAAAASQLLTADNFQQLIATGIATGIAAAMQNIQQQQPPQGRTRKHGTKGPTAAETSGLRYCSSHGYGNHTGKECDNPKDGHDENAKTHTKCKGTMASTKVYSKRN